MFFPSKNIVVITFNDTELSVSEFSRTRTQPELVSSYSTILPVGIISRGAIVDKIKFADYIKAALREAHPSEITTKEAIVVLPESQVYLTLLHFTNSKSLDDVLKEVPKEALATIPLDYNQIYCDFFLASQHNGGKGHDVVYAACDKNIANNYLQLLSEINIKPILFTVEPDALAASIKMPDEKPILFLVWGEHRSYWLLSEGNNIKKVSPSILRLPDGIASEFNISMDSKLFEKVRVEAEAFISAYQAGRLSNEPITKILIWVAGERIKQFVPQISKLVVGLNKALSISTELLNVQFPQESSLIQSAFGAARRFFQKKDIGRGIDLLPERFREQAVLFQLNSFLISLSIMFIIAASAFMSVFSFAWSQMYFDRARAHAEAASSAQNISAPRFMEIKMKTQRFNEEVDILTQIQAQLFAYSTVWRELNEALRTPGIIPTTIIYNAANMSFELVGTVDTRENLRLFQEKLELLSFAQEVISPLSNLDKTINISFSMQIKINQKKLPYIGT